VQSTEKEVSMQYMLLIYDDEKTWRNLPQEEQNALFGEYNAYTEALREAGKFVAADALQGVDTAKSVRVRDDEMTTTDGPFAETKEQFGGYYLIDVDSEDEALEWASKIPSARLGTIEVRPVMVYPAETPA
jgi:hypothetical protein